MIRCCKCHEIYHESDLKECANCNRHFCVFDCLNCLIDEITEKEQEDEYYDCYGYKNCIYCTKNMDKRIFKKNEIVKFLIYKINKNRINKLDENDIINMMKKQYN